MGEIEIGKIGKPTTNSPTPRPKPKPTPRPTQNRSGGKGSMGWRWRADQPNENVDDAALTTTGDEAKFYSFDEENEDIVSVIDGSLFEDSSHSSMFAFLLFFIASIPLLLCIAFNCYQWFGVCAK